MKNYSTNDPKVHTSNVKGKYTELINHLRDDIKKVSDPKLQALFETSAEVIIGLSKAISDYEEKNEDVWKK
jgi:hypothetical protein